jgi:succinate dehydrogenase / fumarate reductase flavoprotein subunit
MQQWVGIRRTGSELDQALEKILELKQRIENVHVGGSRLYNPGWHMSRDIRFMVTVSEAIVRSALLRKESRGAHWRIDYPDKSDELGKVNVITRKVGEDMEIITAPLPEMPEELMKLCAPPPATPSPTPSPR